MDASNFLKQQGTFLKSADVVKSQTKVFTITGEGSIVHNDKYDTDRLHIPGEMDKTPFTLDCSKTNARTIASVLGADTKRWIGCQIALEVYKTKTTEGKMTEAINVSKVIV